LNFKNLKLGDNISIYVLRTLLNLSLDFHKLIAQIRKSHCKCLTSFHLFQV